MPKTGIGSDIFGAFSRQELLRSLRLVTANCDLCFPGCRESHKKGGSLKAEPRTGSRGARKDLPTTGLSRATWEPGVVLQAGALPPLLPATTRVVGSTRLSGYAMVLSSPPPGRPRSTLEGSRPPDPPSWWAAPPKSPAALYFAGCLKAVWQGFLFAPIWPQRWSAGLIFRAN